MTWLCIVHHRSFRAIVDLHSIPRTSNTSRKEHDDSLHFAVPRWTFVALWFYGNCKRKSLYRDRYGKSLFLFGILRSEFSDCQSFVFNFREENHLSWKRLRRQGNVSCLFSGILVAAVFVLIFALRDHYGVFGSDYGKSDICWLGTRNSKLFLFIVPFGVLLSFNVFLFIILAQRLYKN